ncbi:MAG: hypothetical protein V4568_11930 [Pseudomonadota bacterium]
MPADLETVQKAQKALEKIQAEVDAYAEEALALAEAFDEIAPSTIESLLLLKRPQSAHAPAEIGIPQDSEGSDANRAVAMLSRISPLGREYIAEARRGLVSEKEMFDFYLQHPQENERHRNWIVDTAATKVQTAEHLRDAVKASVDIMKEMKKAVEILMAAPAKSITHLAAAQLIEMQTEDMVEALEKWRYAQALPYNPWKSWSAEREQAFAELADKTEAQTAALGVYRQNTQAPLGGVESSELLPIPGNFHVIPQELMDDILTYAVAGESETTDYRLISKYFEQAISRLNSPDVEIENSRWAIFRLAYQINNDPQAYPNALTSRLTGKKNVGLDLTVIPPEKRKPTLDALADCKNLQRLDFRACGLPEWRDQIMSTLETVYEKNKTTLKEIKVNLSDCDLTHENVDTLGTFEPLTVLIISGNGSHEKAHQLNVNGQAEAANADLGRTAQVGRGLYALTELTGLRVLDIGTISPFSNCIVEILQSNPNLVELGVADNRREYNSSGTFTPPGEKEWLSTLSIDYPACLQQLKTLDISNNRKSMCVYAYTAFRKEDCSELEVLRIANCDEIQPSKFKKLAENLSNLRALDISAEDGRQTSAIREIAACANLTHLSIRGAQLTNQETKREEIEIVGEVAKLKKLQALDAQDTGLGNEGLKTLAPLATTLSFLNLRNNARLTDEIAETLQQFKKLRVLDLRGTKLSDETKRKIAAALPHLIHLDGAPYLASRQAQQRAQAQSNSRPSSSQGKLSVGGNSPNSGGKGRR